MPLSPKTQKLQLVDELIATTIDLTHEQRCSLESQAIRELIANNTITVEQAIDLSYKQTFNLQSQNICDLLRSETITLEEVNTLTYLGKCNLESQHIRDLIANNLITIQQAINLTFEQLLSLELQPIEILKHQVPIKFERLEEICNLTYDERINIISPVVRDLIRQEIITFQEAIALTEDEREVLESQAIRNLIADNIITVRRAIMLTVFEKGILELEGVHELLTNRTMTFQQAINLSPNQQGNLQSQAVRALLAGETITFQQAINLSYNQRRALEDDETRARVIAGELTLDDIIGGPVALLNFYVPTPDINDAQSTHNAAVHQAVSASAKRLKNRYGSSITGSGLADTIHTLQAEIMKLSDNSLKTQAAQRCLPRLTALDYTFTDKASNVSTRELLALSFIAIQDDKLRRGSVEDAKNMLVEGLYEIQRGYNLNNSGIDDGELDRFICAGGTFNKLVEKLQGIHPDCEIHFMTQTTAALKLPKIVTEESFQYLAQLATPQTEAALLTFTKLIADIKQQGANVIYDKIKTRVSARMYEEFGSLYKDQTDPAFTQLVDSGEYTKLEPDNLRQFQQQIQNSQGYQQYCSHLLRQHSAFFLTPNQLQQQQGSEKQLALVPIN
ncbi:MAG: hypothetical protein Tsb005_00960 [Gammaproteobacteria bacterium]